MPKEIQPNSTASGASAKPAETTVSKTTPAATAGEGAASPAAEHAEDALSAAAVARLMASDFADQEDEQKSTEPAEAPGETVQPDTKAEATKESEVSEGEQEQTETEETTEPAGDEPEETEETDEKSKLSPDLQKILDKRIGKVVKQREDEKRRADAAEARLQSLQAENQQLKAGATGAALEPMNEEELVKFEEGASRLVEAAQNFMEDAASDTERAFVERFMQSEHLDEAGLKRRVRQLGKMLQAIPARRAQLAQFKQQEAQFEPLVKKHLPFLDDPSAPEYATAQEVVSLFPEIKQRVPGWKAAMGIYVLGMREWKKLTAPVEPAKPAKPAPKPPPKLRPVAAAPKAPTPTEAATVAAQEQFAKAPTAQDAAKLLAMDL